MIVCISSWEKYNPRKRGDTKSGSWFRCQNNFLTDPDFYDYSNDQKMIWLCLLAECSAKMNASIKISPALIASILRISPNLVLSTIEDFQKFGLLSVVADTRRTCGEPAADSQRTRGATDLLTNSLTDSESASAEPAAKTGLSASGLFEIWNGNRGALPSAKSLTDKRRLKAAARIAEESDPLYWAEAVRRLASSSFAIGNNDRGWKADFDWLIANDTNHVKVAEGKYDDRKAAAAAASYAVLTERDLDEL